MGNLWSQTIKLDNPYTESSLYKLLLEIDNSTDGTITIPMNYAWLFYYKNEIPDNVFYPNLHLWESAWKYQNDKIFITLNVTSIVFNVGYNIVYYIGFSTGNINIAVNRFIELERTVDELLIDFEQIRESKIYQLCKFITINGIADSGIIRLIRNNKVLYEENEYMSAMDNPFGIILLNEYETKLCTKITSRKDDIKMSDLAIARMILDKIMSNKFSKPELYEGISISHIKKAA